MSSSTVDSLIPQIKTFIDQGLQATVVVKALRDFDSSNRLGRALEALNYLHLRVAFSSAFVEFLVPLLLDLSKTFDKCLYWQILHDALDKQVKELGAGLLSASFQSSQAEILNFVKKPTPTSNTSSTTVQVDEDEDEWITLVDVEKEKRMTPAQLAAQRKKDQLKVKKLQLRHETFKKWIVCFYQQFEDEHIQKLIRNSDETLFTDIDNPLFKTIKSFQSVNFSTKKEGEEKAYTPSNVKQAWEDIVCIDSDTKNELINNGVDPETVSSNIYMRNRIWYRLNNLMLLAQLEINVKDSSITELLQYCCKLFNDFMEGKVDKLSDLQGLVLGEVKRIMPTMQGEASQIGNFVLEAVFQNIRQFRSSFEKVRNMVPSGLFKLAKGYGYDIETMKIDEIITDKLGQIADLRTKKEAGENVQFLTAENLDYITNMITPSPSNIVEVVKEEKKNT